MYAQASLGATQSGEEIIVDGPNFVMEMIDVQAEGGEIGTTGAVELSPDEFIRFIGKGMKAWWEDILNTGLDLEAFMPDDDDEDDDDDDE